MSGSVYFLQGDYGERPVKIGFCGGDLAPRIRALQVGFPGRLELIGRLSGGRDLEYLAHLSLAEHKIYGEWFRPKPEVLAMARGDLPEALQAYHEDPVAA